MKNLLIYGAALLLAGRARASNEIGNGGDAVVCRNPDASIKNIEVLDYYEARVIRGMVIDLGEPDLDPQKKISLALSRLEKYSPLRVQSYRATVREFFASSRFLHGSELTDIPDSGHIALPAGCKVEQAVNQRDTRFDEDRRFVINGDLWDVMDNNSRAGLMLHEAIYREALGYGHVNSIATRYFNSVISSRKLIEENYFGLQGFLRIVDELPFLNTDFAGINFEYQHCEQGSQRVAVRDFGQCDPTDFVHDTAVTWYRNMAPATVRGPLPGSNLGVVDDQSLTVPNGVIVLGNPRVAETTLEFYEESVSQKLGALKSVNSWIRRIETASGSQDLGRITTVHFAPTGEITSIDP